MEKKEKKSLGESLVEEGLITADQFKQAQEEEDKTGVPLRKILTKMGLIGEEDLVSFLCSRTGIPRIELNNYLIDPKIIALVPEELARKHEIIPVLKIGNRLTCAMVDPWNLFVLDQIRSKTDLIIEPALATEKEIKKGLSVCYGVKGSMEELVESIGAEGFDIRKTIPEEEEIDNKLLEGIAEQPTVIKLVNLVIMNAIKEGASDVHVEPEEKTLRIRVRVDGMLHEIFSPPKHLQSAVISRIKVMSSLDITQRRMPQDGRFTIKIEGREIDVRVSCVPTMFGENIVLRLLDTSSALLKLEQVGFFQETLQKYQKLLSRPHGIILLTGPTGSGKTTMLYASLDKLNTPEKNITTIEDPVEYKLYGIRQIQVNPNVDLRFANGLRSILRQDPDIIMVGEIRDFETAEIAIHASLTGHLVFSTLHTNDAAGAITRLVDIGIEPYLVASSLIGVLAQRLVRTICPECKEMYKPSEEILRDLRLSEGEKIEFFKGKGCPHCMNTGYKGRIGIFELLAIDDEIRDLIVAKVSSEKIEKQARAAGAISLKEAGIQKVKEGLTTLEEILRVTQGG